MSPLVATHRHQGAAGDVPGVDIQYPRIAGKTAAGEATRAACRRLRANGSGAEAILLGSAMWSKKFSLNPRQRMTVLDLFFSFSKVWDAGLPPPPRSGPVFWGMESLPPPPPLQLKDFTAND